MHVKTSVMLYLLKSSGYRTIKYSWRLSIGQTFFEKKHIYCSSLNKVKQKITENKESFETRATVGRAVRDSGVPFDL